MAVGPRVQMEPPVLNASATIATLTGLKPDTKYRVTVTATNSKGLGVPDSIEKMTRSKSEGQTSSSEVEEVTTSVTGYNLMFEFSSRRTCIEKSLGIPSLSPSGISDRLQSKMGTWDHLQLQLAGRQQFGSRDRVVWQRAAY